MQPSLRHIQHYYIDTLTGTKYYKVLFNHEQRSIAGEAGYTGYSSFEESVLGSEELKHSMEDFSSKARSGLRLGKPVGPADKDYYQFSMGDHRIEIKKTSGVFEDIFKVSCYSDHPERLTWKRKL